MWRLSILLPVLSLWLAGCATVSPRDQSPPSYAPEKFRAYIGGMMGPSYTVEYIPPRSLRYTHADHGNVVESTLVDFDPQYWESVYLQMEDVGLFSWRDRYVREGVHDGTQWSLECTFPTRRKTIWGDNAYPAYDEFKAFLALVSSMAGNRKFE
jgi:hypothetical protein